MLMLHCRVAAMEIRASTDAIAEPIEYDIFKAKIISGVVGPKTWVRDPIVTNNEWRTADNTGVFHFVSPIRHPRGELLETELREEGQRVAARAAQSDENQRQLQILWDKTKPGDIERLYGLTLIDELSQAAGVSGVLRVAYFSCWSDCSYVTLTYKDNAIHIDAVDGAYRIQPADGQLRHCATVNQRVERQVRNKKVRPPLNSWMQLKEFLSRTKSFKNDALDGGGYEIQASERGKTIGTFTWGNPGPENIDEYMLLKQFCWLLSHAKMYHLKSVGYYGIQKRWFW
jgi:hypothetical protein